MSLHLFAVSLALVLDKHLCLPFAAVLPQFIRSTTWRVPTSSRLCKTGRGDNRRVLQQREAEKGKWHKPIRMPDTAELFRHDVPVLRTSLARHGLVDVTTSPMERRPSIGVSLSTRASASPTIRLRECSGGCGATAMLTAHGCGGVGERGSGI